MKIKILIWTHSVMRLDHSTTKQHSGGRILLTRKIVLYSSSRYHLTKNKFKCPHADLIICAHRIRHRISGTSITNPNRVIKTSKTSQSVSKTVLFIRHIYSSSPNGPYDTNLFRITSKVNPPPLPSELISFP